MGEGLACARAPAAKPALIAVAELEVVWVWVWMGGASLWGRSGEFAFAKRAEMEVSFAEGRAVADGTGVRRSSPRPRCAACAPHAATSPARSREPRPLGAVLRAPTLGGPPTTRRRLRSVAACARCFERSTVRSDTMLRHTPSSNDESPARTARPAPTQRRRRGPGAGAGAAVAPPRRSSLPRRAAAPTPSRCDEGAALLRVRRAAVSRLLVRRTPT